METAPPRADPSSPWMKHLERAHGLAHLAARAIGEESEPSLHLAPAARHLERGLAAMYDAFDGRADRTTAISLAHSRLWAAAILIARAGLPAVLGALREACTELVDAEERFPRVPLAASAPAPLRAGVDLPALHDVARLSLMPSFRAPPVPEAEDEVPVVVLPEPTTFAELAAAAEAARRVGAEQSAAHSRRKAATARGATEAKLGAALVEPLPGFALVPPPPLTELAFIQRWTRECFEDVGMIGIQRAPLLGDDWRASSSLERRLISAVDAVAALGPGAVAHLEPLAMDAPVVNPMGVFAITMIAGCLEGRDAIACAERVLHHFGPNDPAAAEPFASAMKLAPNPFVASALRALLAAAELGCRALAVEVLAHRGWLTAAELAALADDADPHILALTLPALAAAHHPDLGRALARALADDDPDLHAAALDAMALAAHPQAATAARAAATGALGDRALLPLALVASHDDACWLLDRMRASPTPAAVEAVGWAGLVASVPALIALLDAREEEVQLAAGAALDRLLGAKLVENIEIFPDGAEDVPVVDPDPDPPPRRSLAQLVSDPRDPPPAASTETLEVPSKDPARWRAYWAEHAHRHDPALRLRRGNPYSPSVSLYELDRLPLSPTDRRRLHRELAARTGKLTSFDPHDFVRAQEQSLAAWASLVKASEETPGSWGRAAH